MEFERQFGIEIPDRDAERLTTPREVIDYVCARTGAFDDGRCPSQRAFYRLRRVLRSHTGATRSSVRPSTPLDAIVPAARRRSLRDRLERELGLRVSLHRPRWLRWGIATSGVAAGVAGFAAFRQLAPAALLAALFTGGLFELTRFAAIRFGSSIGALALRAVPGIVSELHAQRSPRRWTRSEVAELVRHLIREQLGIEAFSDDAHFIRDLKMD